MGHLLRLALTVGAAAALLSGCGGSQAGPSVPGLAPLAAKAGGPAKWDLLYVSAGGNVLVFRYWQHTLVQTLEGLKGPISACADSVGNVFIAQALRYGVVEYAHGGKTPIGTFAADKPRSCAVDPRTGDLAIANWEKGVFVYRHGKGKRITYTDPALSRYTALAYDNGSDLLVTSGCVTTTSCSPASFAYLPRNGTKLITIRMPNASGSYSYYYDPSAIQWDGKYWVIAQRPTLTRVSIAGSKATYISATTLGKFNSSTIDDIAIFNNDPKAQGTEVVGTGFTLTTNGRENYTGYFWNYPSGGSPIGSIAQWGYPGAVAISYKTAR